VRAGEVVSQYEIMRFAQLFNDEPFGTDAFLVSRLRTHLAAIKARTPPAAARPAARAPAGGRPRRPGRALA
jgi:hypothetical protein